MNEAQREATKGKKAGGPSQSLLGALSLLANTLLVSEIIRGRTFLGAKTTAEERECLLKKSIMQLTEEARVLGVAVELRQKTEMAEYMRSCIQRDTLSSSTKSGPPMGPLS